jgi:hypothetical protein
MRTNNFGMLLSAGAGTEPPSAATISDRVREVAERNTDHSHLCLPGALAAAAAGLASHDAGKWHDLTGHASDEGFPQAASEPSMGEVNQRSIAALRRTNSVCQLLQTRRYEKCVK